VLGLIYRAIETYLIEQAGWTRATVKAGAVTLMQRFASAVKLNIQFHMLFLEGGCLSPAENHRCFAACPPYAADTGRIDPHHQAARGRLPGA